MITIVLLGLAASTVAHGDDTAAIDTTTTVAGTTTATVAGSTSTSAALPGWPAGVDPSFVPAVNAGRVQLEPLPTLPPTTVPPTTVNPGQSTDIPANSGNGYRVIYAKRAQRVWQINADNTAARTYRVSGRMDRPNPGTYKVWSRSSFTCAIGNSQTCMRFMVRFAHGPEGDNIGFHEIPKNNGRPLQSDSQLGTPLSHGCVRQATADAEAMWAF
ncbi:MAG: L,D-transpeptidase, partial [Ilumatobacteraceae bacterium]